MFTPQIDKIMRLDTQITGLKIRLFFQLNYNQNNFYTDFTKDKPMGQKKRCQNNPIPTVLKLSRAFDI